MSVGDTELLFVTNLPQFEEEMLAVAREVIRLNPSRQNYLGTIDDLRQTADIMEEYLKHLDEKKRRKNEIEGGIHD